jgi:hypothetical protein
MSFANKIIPTIRVFFNCFEFLKGCYFCCQSKANGSNRVRDEDKGRHILWFLTAQKSEMSYY